MGLSLSLTPGAAEEEEKTYDVAIIGGGPAGTSAAIYTARADLKTIVIDKGLTAGALGMTSKIENYPGVPEPVTGAELVERMRRQAERFGAEFVQDKILSTELEGDVKVLWGGEATYKARAVVIATGSMGRGKRVPGEDEFLGRGVSYCATCDAAFFRDKVVAVVGSNDEAVEEALHLTKFVSRLHMIVPTSEIKAEPALVAELTANPKVEVLLSTRLRAVEGNGTVTGVRVAPRGGDEQVLPVHGAFIYLQGARPITDFLDGQLSLSPGGCLPVDDEYRTEIPGVYAVGDVICDHVKQAVVAAAEGVIAALAIDRYLHGRKSTRADWS